MKNKPFIRNLIAVLGITVSIAVIVLSVLQIFGVWQDALYLIIPLLVLNQLGLAYGQWEHNRKIAWFSICASAVIFICYIVVLFVK